MIRRALLALWLLAAASAAPSAAPDAAAEEVVAGLSQNRVAITASFTGSDIFIYGAVKRAAPPPDGGLDVVVVVAGPSRPVLVRKRERQFGVWVNGPGVQIDAAPSLYAVKTTRPFRDVISWTEELRHQVGLKEVIRLIDAPDWLTEERGDYLDAVIRLNRSKGLYFIDEGGVTLKEETLFETSIALPSNLVEGDYTARMFLLRDKEVIDVYETTIPVRKVGLERFLYSFATLAPAAYGIASVILALFSGWAASALFRYFVT
ncbi:MAG: TIGR02186 family protein [Pseudomonadota bacterium]